MKRLVFAGLAFSLGVGFLHAASLRNIFAEQAMNQLGSARDCIRTLLNSSQTDSINALDSARVFIQQALGSLSECERQANRHGGPSASQPSTASKKRRRSDVSADNAPRSALMLLSRAAASASFVEPQEGEKQAISNATGYTCRVCKKGFEQRKTLRRHIKTHVKKNFGCEYCRFGSNSRQKIEDHMRRRHGNRSERISDLRSVASQEGQSEQEPARKRRLLNDQDAASLPRDFASQSSEQDDQVGELPTLVAKRLYRCKSCPKEYQTKVELSRHKSRSHGTRRYQCSQPNCNSAFRYKCYLDRHLKTAHQLCEEMLRCGYCDREYGHLDSIRQHLKRRHGNLEQKIIRVPVEESQIAGMPGASEANGLKREVKPELSPDENRD